MNVQQASDQNQAVSRSLRINEVLKRVPVSRSTWLAGVKAGRYPEPIYLGPRIVAWREEEIQRLVENGILHSKKEV